MFVGDFADICAERSCQACSDMGSEDPHWHEQKFSGILCFKAEKVVFITLVVLLVDSLAPIQKSLHFVS